jgi:CheY-like chemotaxis protein
MSTVNNILLVDDDEDDCYLFTFAAKKVIPFCSLTCTNNFLEAVSFLTTATPDIIFLDLNMPFKKGLDCLSELKRNEQFRNIPVVIFSTSDYPKDIKMAYERGAALYFIKPSSFDDLTLALKQILNKDWKRAPVITAQQFIDGQYKAFSLVPA